MLLTHGCYWSVKSFKAKFGNTQVILFKNSTLCTHIYIHTIGAVKCVHGGPAALDLTVGLTAQRHLQTYQARKRLQDVIPSQVDLPRSFELCSAKVQDCG